MVKPLNWFLKTLICIKDQAVTGTVIVGDFNAPHSSLCRTFKWKQTKKL